MTPELVPPQSFEEEIAELFDSLDGEERMDSTLSSVISGMGTDRDWTTSIDVDRRTILSRDQAHNLSTHPLINRICTAHADAAIRKKWELILGDNEDVERQKNINAEMQHLELYDAFNEAQFQANIYGGAVIIQLIEDGRPADQPIDFNNIKSVRGYRVLDRHKIRPRIIGYQDPIKVEYYEVILTEFLSKSIKNIKNDRFKNRFKNGYLIHRSRIIRFDGTRATPDLMLENDGWSPSLIEQLWDQYKLYKTTLQSAAGLLKDFSLFVIYWQGLLELMRAQDKDEKEKLRKQLILYQQMASIFGGIFVDKENQSVEFPSRNLSGLDQASNLQRDAFIGESGLPHTKIFGESPSGLGATGESEERNWAQEVGNFQVSRWEKKIRKAAKPILNAKELNVVKLKEKNFTINFPSIIQLSEEEIVQNRATQSQTDSTYFNMGLPAKQILKDRFSGNEYSIETNFDEKAFDIEQQKQEQAGGFGGFGDFGNYGTTQNEYDIEIPTEPVEPKTDSADSTKRIVRLHGLEIGINNEVGETRFRGAKPLTAAYGHIRGSYGDALDGMALDVYLGNYLDNSDIYKVRQLVAETGEIDEDKYFIGFASQEQAKNYFLKYLGQKRFGGISKVTTELEPYKKKVNYRKDAAEPDIVDKITINYRDRARDAVGDWVSQISDWLEDKESWNQVQGKEAELFDLIAKDGNGFTQLIEESTIISNLAGREEAIADEEK